VPLSIQPDADATAHFEIGRAMAGLADEGVLVIGSGGFVHNLGELAWGQPDAPMPGWAREFRDWMRDRVLDGDIDALLDWERQAPHARQAHPTPEHLLPLFVALGAAGKGATVRHLHDSHEYGSLALDAFAFG
jgi:4,5-DOPA dioxygenase extradiol